MNPVLTVRSANAPKSGGGKYRRPLMIWTRRSPKLHKNTACLFQLVLEHSGSGEAEPSSNVMPKTISTVVLLQRHPAKKKPETKETHEEV